MSHTGTFRMTHDTLWPISWSGGASRDRTGDLLVANQTLSQLSYGPLVHKLKSSRRFQRTSLRCPRAKSVVFARYAEVGPHSPAPVWWVWEELNLRPHPYQGCALTN